MEKKKIELCIPAERAMLLIARMTTSGVVSRAGFTLDEMDDMKMAVDEACNLMMLQKPCCNRLHLIYSYDDQSVEVVVEGRDYTQDQGEKTDKNMMEVIRCILETMVDEVELTERGNGQIETIIMKKDIPNNRRSAV